MGDNCDIFAYHNFQSLLISSYYVSLKFKKCIKSLLFINKIMTTIYLIKKIMTTINLINIGQFHTAVMKTLCHLHFQLDFSKKKGRAIVVTPVSASGSVKFSVKFFVRVHFSKIIKGIHLKLGILVHYQKRNQLQQGR